MWIEIVQEGNRLATEAMAAAKATHVAAIKAKGEEAWARAVRNCGGEHAVEPMYCGRASVVVPRKLNALMIKELKTVVNDRTNFGSPIGYSSKGRHTPTDWQFYCPGTYNGQSMDIYEEGARVFLKHLEANGVVGAFMTSRAD